MPQLIDRSRSTFSSESSGPRYALLPDWVIPVGLASWAFIGVAGVVLIVAAFLAASSGISVPLILAAVVGAIVSPLAQRLIDRGLNRTVAAVIVLVGIVTIGGVAVWIAVRGVLSQAPQIVEQIQNGIAQLTLRLAVAGVDAESLRSILSSLSTTSPEQSPLVSGLFVPVTSALSAGLSGFVSLLFGLVISGALLVYVLSDFSLIVDWVGSNIGLPPQLGRKMILDAVDTLRAYFRATTLSGLVVSVVIGVAVWAFGLPLAIPIALVTFVTCYIPFFGAIFSGTFACLVALGSGGVTEAFAVLVVVLIAQNVIQTLLNAKLMGDSLRLHPLAVLVVTMLGGIFGGILGAALAAPMTAFAVRAVGRFREFAAEQRRLVAETELVGSETPTA